MDGERGGMQERPMRGWVVCSVRLRVKMEKETGSRGNMDIFAGRSHLSGLFYRYLLTSHGWKNIEVKKKLASGYTGVREIFKSTEVMSNFHKDIQVKDSISRDLSGAVDGEKLRNRRPWYIPLFISLSLGVLGLGLEYLYPPLAFTQLLVSVVVGACASLACGA